MFRFNKYLNELKNHGVVKLPSILSPKIKTDLELWHKKNKWTDRDIDQKVVTHNPFDDCGSFWKTFEECPLQVLNNNIKTLAYKYLGAEELPSWFEIGWEFYYVRRPAPSIWHQDCSKINLYKTQGNLVNILFPLESLYQPPTEVKQFNYRTIILAPTELGNAIMFDGTCWHRVTPNDSIHPRYTLMFRYFIRERLGDEMYKPITFPSFFEYKNFYQKRMSYDENEHEIKEMYIEANRLWNIKNI